MPFPLLGAYTWNDDNDTIYVFYSGHGTESVLPGSEPITCSWANSATVIIGAAAFYNVDPTLAEFSPSIVTVSDSSSSPSIEIPSNPNDLTFAVMMRATQSSALFSSAGPQSPATQVWADNATAEHNSVATQAAGVSSVTHMWPLTESAPWYAVGINISVAPPNFIDIFLPEGAQGIDLESLVVGQGADEALFVGITSPGPLTGLAVTWDGQIMDQVDDRAIPDAFVECLQNCTDTQAHLYWYSLVAPHPGNQILNVSWTADTADWGEPIVDVGAISFSGVDQSSPISLPVTYADGLEDDVDGVDSITIATNVGDETVALWGSVNGNGFDWNQEPNWPGDEHGIGSESSRAPGSATSNIHSIMHSGSCCNVGYWGMSGLNIADAGTTDSGPGRTTHATKQFKREHAP